MIVKYFQKLWWHVSHLNQIRFKILLILTLLLSVFEAITLGSLMPFLTAVSMPEKLLENGFFVRILASFDVKTQIEVATFATLIFVLCTIVTAVLRFLVMKMQFKFAHQSSNDIALAIFDTMINKEYVLVSQQNSSEIVSALTQKTTQMINSAIMPLLQLSSAISIFVVLVTGLLIIDWRLTLGLCIILVSIYAGFMLVTKSKIKLNSEFQSIEYDRLILVIQETFGGIREIILGNYQHDAKKKFSNSQELLRQSQSSTLFLAASPKLLLEAVVYIAIAGTAYRAFFEAGSLATSIPTLGGLAYAAQRLMPIIQQIYANTMSIKGCSNLLEDLCNFLENDQQVLSKTINPSETKLFQKNIKLTKVSFSYPNSEINIFDNVCMEINPGDRIGILGKTGSGKSTLLDVILGLLEPSVGDITCDGISRNQINQKDWFNIFAHVPQFIYLADKTIFENIAGLGERNHIDDARLKEMAKIAQIKDEIDGFKDGFSTVVGERGVRLSGGQIQRLGIARALYREAKIIVFDEATSAIDSKIEEKIEKSLNLLSKDLTIIKVAHRLHTLRNCNKIFKLEHGRLHFYGNFEDFERTEGE